MLLLYRINIHYGSVLLPIFLVAVFCAISAVTARAELNGTVARIEKLLGPPVKKSGNLIYYHKSPYFYITHVHGGTCDQICVFLDRESQGLPLPLTDDEIQYLLSNLGGKVSWSPVARFSINRVWNSRDGKCFAIYETMYNKLVLSTRDAYRRERKKDTENVKGKNVTEM